jgi:adenine-specific DNA-methyltransferase
MSAPPTKQFALFEETRPCEAWAWEGDFLNAVEQRLSDEDALQNNALESLYNNFAPYEYRKVKGQFFTPPALAEFMVDWLLETSPASLLDPAVGLGVFLRCALRKPHRFTRVVGYEIDPVLAKATQRILTLNGGADCAIVCDDFLLAPPHETFDAVIANPPYIRHHDLSYPPSLFQAFDRRFDVRLSRLTNVYGLFLLQCDDLLSPNGRAAILTPSEFLNADFGVPLKRFLLDRNALGALVLFDHAHLVFDGILTTACITLLEKNRKPDEPIRFIRVSDEHRLKLVGTARLCQPQSADRLGVAETRRPYEYRVLRRDELDPKAKWDALFKPSRKKTSQRLVCLGDIAQTMRGIATGANHFFTLSEEEARHFPPQYLKPCLTKAPHAPFFDFTPEDFDALKQQGKKVYLLDCDGVPPPALVDYFKAGEREGLHRRYLTSKRTLWYAMEKRTIAPILVTVFGRGGLRFVLNRARVWNLTAFHCVYPRFDDERLHKALMAYLVSRHCAELLDREKRVYGDGLIKAEPRDILSLPVLDVTRLPDTTVTELSNLFDALRAIRRADANWRNSAAEQELERWVGFACKGRFGL